MPLKNLWLSLLAIIIYTSLYSQTITGVTSLCQGPSTTLTVTGAPGGSTYQWQRSDDGGATWTNIAGATTISYNVTAVAFYTVIVTTSGIPKTLTPVELSKVQSLPQHSLLVPTAAALMFRLILPMRPLEAALVICGVLGIQIQVLTILQPIKIQVIVLLVLLEIIHSHLIQSLSSLQLLVVKTQ
jgi:hypothetical protein